MRWKSFIPHLDRAILILAITIILLILLACVGYMSGRWEDDESGSWFLLSAKSQTVPPCVADEEARERIRGITLQALDEALEEQIKFLFMVWMKDDRGQPDRARVGVSQAVRAHQHARKLAEEWMPPICQN